MVNTGLKSRGQAFAARRDRSLAAKSERIFATKTALTNGVWTLRSSFGSSDSWFMTLMGGNCCRGALRN
jgi:hypothetical protein